MTAVLLVFLIATSVALALPAICDAWMLLARRRDALPPPASGARPRLLFLVPAHDEETIVGHTVASLRGQHYPAAQMDVLVVADNCSDATAAAAAGAGAQVLERTTDGERGKGHAIRWALARVPVDDYAAIVIIDADTIVEPDYATHIGEWPQLERAVLQTYDSLSNETANWLTRLAGLFTRNRYEIALPLKRRAGLNCPLTGDGIVIGSNVLREHGWNPQTITEGWELYAVYSLAGLTIGYESRSRLYAQETVSLRQSRTQRERWTSGRLAVFATHWRAIVSSRRLSLLQRLDLVAELSNLGPIVRAVLGMAGFVTAWRLLDGSAQTVAMTLYASSVAQPALYSVITLTRHPEPWPTVMALFRLPLYALWRVVVAVSSIIRLGRRSWIRTRRHDDHHGSGDADAMPHHRSVGQTDSSA